MNGFTPPSPGTSKGFEWVPDYDLVIEQIAATNLVDADWQVLKDILKYKLSHAIRSYLSLGPPWPLPPDEAYAARGRAYEALDGFTAPPFTIQRICELILTPRRHYTSLPKYLRALTRALNVTSPRSNFTEDESDFSYATTSSITIETGVDGSRSHARVVLSAAGGVIPTRRPSVEHSPLHSPKSSPSMVPLLSPIPWLTKEKEEDLESVKEFDLNASGGKNGLSLATRLGGEGENHSMTVAPPSAMTATPTGGLVDEVDPGSGGQETSAPVALTQAAASDSPSNHSPPKPDPLEVPTTLEERFVRRSSPRKDLPELERIESFEQRLEKEEKGEQTAEMETSHG